jgi:pimeloyl-ACP methyl ester carboxylesterase
MTVPTLFIRGEKSNYILETDFDALQEQFIQSEIVTIPGAGHWVHAEAPQQFLHELMRFICN